MKLALFLAAAVAAGAVGAPAAGGDERPRRETAARPATVTLDVKDAEARDVLKVLQKQCGIRNLVIDPGVPKTAATFYFREVPCETAFRVVLRTYGLAQQVERLD